MNLTDTLNLRFKLEQLRSGFLSQLVERVAVLRKLGQQPLSDEVAGKLRLQAHKLAGSAGIFGFVALGEAAGRLERLLGSRDLAVAGNKSTSREISDCVAEIEQLVREASSEEPDQVAAALRPSPPGLPLIYLLEDDAEQAELLSAHLSEAGYTVQIFASAKALAGEECEPLALIMDIMLPEGTDAGLEVMREYARQKPDIPIIAISVRDDLEARLEAWRAGAVRYLQKPVDFGRLVRILDGLTGRTRREPYRVLLVDDDIDLLNWGEAVLAAAGMQVRMVVNPFHALEAALDFLPDVFVIDLNMPGISGAEMAALLREHDTFAQTPILFLSVESDPAKQLAALRVGGDEFLTKPLAPELLVAAVEARAQRSRHVARLMAELGSSEARSKAIVDTVLDSIVTIDAGGIIQSVNPATVKTFGYPAAEMLGRNVSMLMPAPYADAHDGYLQDYLTTGQRKVIGLLREVLARRKDGSVFPVELAVSEMFVGDQRMFVGILHDISARKRQDVIVQASERSLRTTLEATADGILAVAGDGRVSFANKRFYEMWGVPEELRTPAQLDENLLAYVEAQLIDPPAFKARVQALHGTDREDFEVLEFVDGRIFERYSRPMAEQEEVPGRVWSFRDVTERRQARDRMKGLSLRLRLALESAQLGIWDRDLKTNKLVWDARMFEIYGIDPADFAGNYEAWRRCVHPDDRPVTDVAVESAGSAKGAYEREFRIVRPDGEVRHIRSFGQLVQDEAGKPVRMVGVNFDVTEHAMSEAALKDGALRLSLALRSAQMGTWDWDLASNQMRWDERLREIYGIEPERLDANYDDWRERVYPDDLPKVEAGARAAMASGEIYHDEFRIIRPDGEIRYLESWGQAIWDSTGKPVRRVGVNLDITERKQSELAMKQARREAEEATEAKSLFLANMSHELRTPMNAILGFSQLLELETEGEQREHVGEILAAGYHLLELINEILELEKIESGHVQLTFELVDAGEIVAECLNLVEPMARKRDIRLLQGKVCEGVVLRADRTRLKQALLNYLSNAIKYNREGGQVQVDGVPGEAGYCRLQVRDTGEGITPAQCAKLFHPFTRLAEHVNQVEGAGIGLVITKRLIELMDGKVGLESEPGVGSTFWFELPAQIGGRPVKSAELLHSPTEHAEATRRSLVSVLCIEDNPANLRLISRILTGVQGFEVRGAHTAALGLELARAQRPDIILMDINLPGMDGYEALKQCQEDPTLATIPVIAISAQAMEEEIQKGLRAGFCAYLTKPLRVQALRQALDEALAAG